MEVGQQSFRLIDLHGDTTWVWARNICCASCNMLTFITHR